MESANEPNKHSLPPWEYRQLTQVPYTTVESHNSETHQRQGSRSTLPELKTEATPPPRLVALLKKSNTTEPAMFTNSAPAPYETQFDMTPRRQSSIESSSASTSATTTPASLCAARSLPGAMSSSSRDVRSKRRKRRQGPSVDESSKSDGFASTLKGLFTSRSSARSTQDCERLQQGHWSEDNY